MAGIEPISDKIGWGAKAAAGDALNRVPNEAPFIGMWVENDANGLPRLKWSKANFNFQHYSIVAVAMMEFAQAMVREEMKSR